MEFLANWIINIPGFAVPFALAALGLIFSERAGVLNLGAEGFMLAGALAGAGLSLTGAEPLVALAGATVSGAAMGLLFAALAVSLRVNHVISGLAIVFFAQALTSYIATQQGWTNRSFAGLGPIALRQDLLVFVTPVLCLGTVWVLGATRFGLSLRSVGENPGAADAAGIDVTATRLAAVVIGAALMGLAGGYLTVAVSKVWVDGVVGGRGWIAIALVIFARWHPWRALAGAVLFGCIEALIPRVNAAGFAVPQYFLQMSPYLATLAVMAWSAKRGSDIWSQPAALGRHHIREERD
ncbi:ABC transporter permease [Maritimibacter sp. UBA3975]|uniref:ABC transporter permease n=1 Tax=Maritimibacter sp. UBA3975 TaxID=1946833 RepID=UPI000C0A41BC|nr:ABC transporter permease [Maritimibacter sp. UBA3975]MAM60275.1 ABC transporter permease [Maritimibacter sp.]|tara:strand:+ start:10243 stop:11130 length:888 start_codon:yes stop_codon:yes gene_type:complete